VDIALVAGLIGAGGAVLGALVGGLIPAIVEARRWKREDHRYWLCEQRDAYVRLHTASRVHLPWRGVGQRRPCVSRW
jgi:hypothetical protein